MEDYSEDLVVSKVLMPLGMETDPYTTLSHCLRSKESYGEEALVYMAATALLKAGQCMSSRLLFESLRRSNSPLLSLGSQNFLEFMESLNCMNDSVTDSSCLRDALTALIHLVSNEEENSPAWVHSKATQMIGDLTLLLFLAEPAKIDQIPGLVELIGVLGSSSSFEKADGLTMKRLGILLRRMHAPWDT